MRGVRRRPSVHQYKKQPSLREKKAKRPRLSVCPKEAHPVGLRCPRRSLGPRPAPPSKDVTPSWTSQTWSSWSPDTQKHKFAIFFPNCVSDARVGAKSFGKKRRGASHPPHYGADIPDGVPSLPNHPLQFLGTVSPRFQFDHRALHKPRFIQLRLCLGVNFQALAPPAGGCRPCSSLWLLGTHSKICWSCASFSPSPLKKNLWRDLSRLAAAK